MPHPRRLVFALTSIVAVSTSTGCSRKQIVERPILPAQRPTQPPTQTPSPTPVAPKENRSDSAVGAQRAALEERIYFRFDQWDLSPTARAILVAKVDVLRAIPAATRRIEGHADERGSDEYNLALSNRRSGEAKRFLVQHGIDTNRLQSIGLGEEQPLEPGHVERAWAMNRRAEFRVTGGLGGR